MLVVITVVAIIASVVITHFDPVSHDQLLGTAQVVAADIAHARNLAVTNNSSYKITFDPAGNRYVLTHNGINRALDVLPASAFHSTGGSTTQHITDLSSLPLGSTNVSLAVVETGDLALAIIPEPVLDVEFGPLGETTRTSRTTIWLSAGSGNERKFIGIEIDPITGLTSIGTLQMTAPETLARDPTYDAPGTYPDPGYPDPGYPDPGYTGSGYTDPGYTGSGYDAPGDPNPAPVATP